MVYTVIIEIPAARSGKLPEKILFYGIRERTINAMVSTIGIAIIT